MSDFDSSIWDVFYQNHEEQPSISKNDVYTCKNCNTSGYKFGSVCTKCGYDDGIYICEEAEWVSGVSEDGKAYDPSRVGAPKSDLFSANFGNGTVISMTGKNSGKYRLVSKINYHSSINHVDRALYKAYCEFDSVGLKLNLPGGVLQAAKGYYKKFSETQLTRGAVRAGVKANCLFWACKNKNATRTTHEIADAFGIDSNDVSRTYDMARDVICPSNSRITKASDLIPRILTEMNLFECDSKFRRLKMACIKFADMISMYPKLMGKTPSSIAAVSIFRVFSVTEYDITKDDVAEAAGVSKATINKIDGLVKALLPK
tara:strand:+ start:998 stop:1945 length:948 start_codon:yes stop_codon:yes gene_type:complete